MYQEILNYYGRKTNDAPLLAAILMKLIDYRNEISLKDKLAITDNEGGFEINLGRCLNNYYIPSPFHSKLIVEPMSTQTTTTETTTDVYKKCRAEIRHHYRNIVCARISELNNHNPIPENLLEYFKTLLLCHANTSMAPILYEYTKTTSNTTFNADRNNFIYRFKFYVYNSITVTIEVTDASSCDLLDINHPDDLLSKKLIHDLFVFRKFSKQDISPNINVDPIHRYIAETFMMNLNNLIDKH